MIWKLLPPTPKNENTGNISVSMEALNNPAVTHFSYVGNINGTYVNVCMPKDQVYDACIFIASSKCDSGNCKCPFALLPKEQIINYHLYKRMNKAKRKKVIKETALF